MSMGRWSAEARVFDGSGCVRCYYDAYNTLLANMTAELHHVAFV